MKININKGSGTFLEYTITSVFLTFILLMIIGLFIKRYSIENFELYSETIARDVITCSSLEEAQVLAQQELGVLFVNTNTIELDSLNISVDYAVGSAQEWKKGNYIVINITGDIKETIILPKTRYSTQIMMMIENNG